MPGMAAPTLWRCTAGAEQIVGPGDVYDWDNHPRQPVGQVVLQWTTVGSLLLETPMKRWHVLPDTVMLFRYGDRSRYYKQPGTTYQCLWVCLHGAGVSDHYEAVINAAGPVIELGNNSQLQDRLRQMVAATRQGISGEDDIHHAQRCYELMTTTLSLARGPVRQSKSPVERAYEFMESNPWANQTLVEVALRFGVSREHLSRFIKEKTGQPARDWLLSHRLPRAEELLKHTDLPMRTVAMLSGFGSDQALARAVQQALGCKPSELRTKVKEGSQRTR